jgi:hypothetical protein
MLVHIITFAGIINVILGHVMVVAGLSDTLTHTMHPPINHSNIDDNRLITGDICIPGQLGEGEDMDG